MSTLKTSNMSVLEAPKEYLEVFSDFSQFIASDDSLSIYRRFGSLATRSILYMQSELHSLEQELAELDEADIAALGSSSDPEEKKMIDSAARDWEAFEYHASHGNKRQERKKVMMDRVKLLMKDYEEALLRHSQVLTLGQPSKGALKAFTGWFRTRMPFRGASWHLLDNEEDMVALKRDMETDRLSLFINHYFSYFLKVRNVEVPRSWASLYYFPAARVEGVSAMLSILLSTLLLLGAILALYFLPASNMGKRLGVIAVFTIAFAVSISLLTNAKRGEMFAATAAYAAVLVVFLSAPTP